MAGNHGDSQATFVTNTDLLDRLRTSSHPTLWNLYADRYRPLVVSYARRCGLSADESEDVAQLTLTAFYEALRDGKYDRDRGRLRSWLFGIAFRQLRNWRRKRQRDAAPMADSGADPASFVELADEDRMAAVWEEEWRDAVVRQCLQTIRTEVRPKSFEAFRLFLWEQWPARRVAEKLGISENAVRGAKRRILRRVRELLPMMEEVW